MATPSGWMWELATRLRTIISASSTFQTWTSTASAAAALEYIHYLETRADGDLAQAKWAFVGPAIGHSMDRMSAGTGLAAFRWQRSVRIGFIETVTYSDDAVVTYMNNVGAILSDICDHASAASITSIAQVDDTTAPLRWRSDDVNEGLQVYFTVTARN